MKETLHLLTIPLMLIDEINQSKGWDRPNDENMDRKLLMAVGEIAEAQGELRKGHSLDYTYHAAELGFWCKAHHRTECAECTQREFAHYELSKPEGFTVEILDAIMRLAHAGYCAAGMNGLQLQQLLDEKLTYNAQRPFQHGGRKF